jgi:hypothetical protein
MGEILIVLACFLFYGVKALKFITHLLLLYDIIADWNCFSNAARLLPMSQVQKGPYFSLNHLCLNNLKQRVQLFLACQYGIVP